MTGNGRTILFVIIALIVVFAGMVGTGAFILFITLSNETPDVDSGSVLMCDLRSGLSEMPERSIRDHLFGRRPVNITETVRLLRYAADDSRVDRVVLRVGGLERIGWGGSAEIRDALQVFRDAGKPVDAFIETAGDLSYYIAAAAGHIYLAPGGVLAVDGLYAEVQFLKNLFAKVNISFEAVTAGKYKSYPEPFLNDTISDAYRMQIDHLLDGRFDTYVEAIALGRTMSPVDVVKAIDEGPYLVAPAAEEAGLVDSLLFWKDYELWRGIDEDGDAPLLTLEEYRDSGVLPGDDARHTIAVVYVVGEIMPGESREGLNSTVAGSESVVDEIDKAAEDDDVEAIVLRVSSPGGSVLASDAIWRAVERAKELKPVVVSMGDVAASGGYWISSGADEIVADATTVTGSIGVFALRPVWNELFEGAGVGVEEFTRGRNAAIFRSAKPWSDDHRRVLRRSIEKNYSDFLRRVSDGRGLTVEEVDEIAGGRIWLGTEALDNGLVDRIGGIVEAVGIAREHAGISPSDEVGLRIYPEEKSLLDQIRDGDFNLRAFAREEARAMLEESGISLPSTPPFSLADGVLWATLPFRLKE